MVGLGAHHKEAVLREHLLDLELAELRDLALGGVEERESAVLVDQVGIGVDPGLQPDLVDLGQVAVRLGRRGSARGSPSRRDVRDSRTSRSTRRAAVRCGRCAARKRNTRSASRDRQIAHLPGPRAAEAGRRRIADHRRHVGIDEHVEPAEMAGPEGVVAEDHLVRHQRVLADVAADLGELHHAVQHGRRRARRPAPASAGRPACRARPPCRARPRPTARGTRPG